MPTRLLTALSGAFPSLIRRMPDPIPPETVGLLDALPDGIIVWDRSDGFLLCNQAARLMLRPIETMLRPDRSWHHVVRAAFARGLFGGLGEGEPDLKALLALRRMEIPWLECRLPGGRWLLAMDRPLADGRRMSVFSDISDRKQRELDTAAWWGLLEQQARDVSSLADELAGAKQLADGANKAKSAFLASMSHELRTPLNAVLGFAEIIRDQLFGRQDIDRYSAYAADVHASGQHLLTLINDILDLSKIEAGKMELREEVVDLDSILASTLSLMKGAAGDRRITLRRLARERVALRADATKLKQCVLNVIANAIKFTPPGGTVTVKVTADPTTLCIAIVDTGVGIAPADFDKVFQPFGQIDDAYTRNGQGTGLGMPITKSFIELHGGTVELISELGRGTAVHLNLPFHRVETHDLFNPDDYASSH